ncbi:hypothetical protein HMPREF9078_02319, partial [Capnocytophaga sp. oral taxon 380 str. F0488]
FANFSSPAVLRMPVWLAPLPKLIVHCLSYYDLAFLSLSEIL